MKLLLSNRFPLKRAFITGAASGLGLALCEDLARDGWTIGMGDVRADALALSADRIRSLGAQVHTYTFDTTDRAAFQFAVDGFAATQSGIDLFVNNAGVAGGGPMGEFTLEDWDWLLGINLGGVVNGCHFAIQHLKRQGSGHIINVASAAGFIPVPEMSAYCTAKAGVRMLSEVLYNELAPFGVGVTVAMPTFFQTNLHERVRGQSTEQAKFLITSSPHTAQQVAHTLLEAAGRGDVRMIYGNDAKLVWKLLRLMPNRSMKLIQARAARMKSAFGRAAAKQMSAPAEAE